MYINTCLYNLFNCTFYGDSFVVGLNDQQNSNFLSA